MPVQAAQVPAEANVVSDTPVTHALMPYTTTRPAYNSGTMDACSARRDERSHNTAPTTPQQIPIKQVDIAENPPCNKTNKAITTMITASNSIFTSSTVFGYKLAAYAWIYEL
jgi:hypothetical protein